MTRSKPLILAPSLARRDQTPVAKAQLLPQSFSEKSLKISAN